MTNPYLGREDAPIQPETWSLLDSAMVEAAKSVLAGRRLLHIEGPYGLGLKAVPLEDCQVSECMAVSQFVPVHLISTTFTVGIRDLLAFEQNGLPFSAEAAAEAAIECARNEDTLIFEGGMGSPGLLEMEGTGALKLSSWSTVGKAADDIIQAMIVQPGARTLTVQPPLPPLPAGAEHGTRAHPGNRHRRRVQGPCPQERRGPAGLGEALRIHRARPGHDRRVHRPDWGQPGVLHHREPRTPRERAVLNLRPEGQGIIFIPLFPSHLPRIRARGAGALRPCRGAGCHSRISARGYRQDTLIHTGNP